MVGPAAHVDWARVQCLDIELLAGANLTPGKAIMGRHLILHGKFCGNAVLTGSLRVHESGDFSGQVRAAGLQVEEGGGLRASLDINPAHAPPPEPAKPAKPPGPARTAMSRPGIAKPAPTPPASDTRKGPDP